VHMGSHARVFQDFKIKPPLMLIGVARLTESGVLALRPANRKAHHTAAAKIRGGV
jgi:hypothetical protein